MDAKHLNGVVAGLLALYEATNGLINAHVPEPAFRKKLGRDFKLHSNLAVLIYSGVKRDSIATAEIAFEVSPMDGIPFDPSNSKGVFTSINSWPVYYDERAPVFYEECQELYGADSLLVNVQIGALNYNFRGEPSLTLNDLFKVIESMSPFQHNNPSLF